MVAEPWCHYCRRFDAEVAPQYEASKQGAEAPLVRVRRDDAMLSGLQPVLYTPTFILVRGNEERGRISGYPGQMYFWHELSDLLARAGFERPRADGQTSPGPLTAGQAP